MSTTKEVTTTSAPSVLSNWTQEELGLIKSTIAVGATDAELKLYLQTCLRTHLDPFMRQIYFVKRGGKATTQVSIDGFRAIAARTGKYAGNDDPVFDNEQKPTKATVTVYRMVGGQRCPFTATARWDQYFPGEKLGFMWNKMPHLMLGKCAEALALRKAFPEALAGIYSEDEMQQAGRDDTQKTEVIDAPAAGAPSTPASPEQKPKEASTDQLAEIMELTKELDMNMQTDIFDKMNIVDRLPYEQEAEIIIAKLRKRKADRVAEPPWPKEPTREKTENGRASAESIRKIASLANDLKTEVQTIYSSAGVDGQPTQKQADEIIARLEQRLLEEAEKAAPAESK